MDQPHSSAESTEDNEAGQIVGSYRILKRLGSGGMSSVFCAAHVQTGHLVALKVLTRALARNSTLLQRFLREARSVETLEHPNIVTIYDRGMDRGRHYLVLEYAPGGDLHEYVREHGPLGFEHACSIVIDVARALSHAAGRGLIHRDIKPSNLLLTDTGVVKVIDLGLALQSEHEDERVTREGTTVGTVDYMAPEQARDSRATSIHSDMYSLGCTFYFLLTGVPPYPGGDIIEKLTRHARADVPDVRDLRQDVPVPIATILTRMMAKRPEDRFATYEELIRAFDEALGITSPAVEIAQPPPSPPAEPKVETAGASGDSYTLSDEPSSAHDVSSHELGSLADLDSGDPVETNPASRTARNPNGSPSVAVPLPRMSTALARGLQIDGAAANDLPPEEEQAAAGSRSVWIITSAVIVLVCLLLGIGIAQLFVVGEPVITHDSTPNANDLESAVVVIRPRRDPNAGIAKVEKLPVAAPARPAWREPVDEIVPAPVDPSSSIRSRNLPDWARAVIPERISGPNVSVRRIADASDPSAFPLLAMAFNSNIGGTVELADEGPLFIDDLRLPGDSRLIRARPGFRPIIRILEPTLEIVRNQPGAFHLDRESLVIDGVDLIVDARDLSPTRSPTRPSALSPALFHCEGADLTLRNCTVTVLNHTGTSPFTVIRVAPSPARPTRILLDRTLIRGIYDRAIDVEGAAAEVVFHQSILVGSAGPLIRVAADSKSLGQRLFLIESVLSGPGPIIDRGQSSVIGRTEPLAIQASGTAFGRFQGPGIASVIVVADEKTPLARIVDWKGDHNVFAGWKGILARGKESTVAVADLAAIRSTWNASEEGSSEVLLSWTAPVSLVTTLPSQIGSFHPATRSIARAVAEPRAGLLEKAVVEYQAPFIPRPTNWALDRPIAQSAVARQGGSLVELKERSDRRRVPPPQIQPPPNAGPGVELAFDTAMPPWNGDLGAFLKEKITAETRRARIRITGTGPHRTSPVRLPDGLWLELVVVPSNELPPPSWAPQPESTGPALFELTRGALAMSGVTLRSEETAHLEHLLHVRDGHLLLTRCQLVGRKASGNFQSGLIAFHAATTEPFMSEFGPLLFADAIDRPVCRLRESILITDATAIEANIGRGLIDLEESAIAAGSAAIEINPSRVARARFDADLWLDHCTLTSEDTLIRAGPWPGLSPGPDRPWLVTSRSCAFLAMSDRRPRETIVLRSNPDALARGTYSWQGTNDVLDLDNFIAASDADPSGNGRPRDVYHQWIEFWGANHIKHASGPALRGPSRGLKVRFRVKLRPGAIEPSELALDPTFHPGADKVTVGATFQPEAVPPVAARGVPPGQRRMPSTPNTSAPVPY
jgi:serine/threonine-protein kinase